MSRTKPTPKQNKRKSKKNKKKENKEKPNNMEENEVKNSVKNIHKIYERNNKSGKKGKAQLWKRRIMQIRINYVFMYKMIYIYVFECVCVCVWLRRENINRLDQHTHLPQTGNKSATTTNFTTTARKNNKISYEFEKLKGKQSKLILIPMHSIIKLIKMEDAHTHTYTHMKNIYIYIYIYKYKWYILYTHINIYYTFT